MKALKTIVVWLLIIGGLNWGLVGLNPSWNVVEMIFGQGSAISSIVYVLVGLAALYKVVMMFSKDHATPSGGGM